MLFQDIILDLVSVLKDQAFLSITIDNRIKKSNYNEQDKKLYTKIMYGVVENKLLIDYYLQPLVKGIRVKPIPRQALRCATYAIDNLHLQNHYIVNEVVSVLKKIDHNSASFVNAVLRNYLESPKPDLNKLPLLERKSIELSIPFDLLKLLHNQYHEEVFEFYQESSRLNQYRINTLKISKEEVLKELDNNQIDYEINNNCLKTNVSLINNLLFKEGYIIAQDESSMKVAEVVNPKSKEEVLDVCSAPGGKSLYMATLMNNQGYILSCDVSEEKINKINDNIKKLGNISIIETKVLDGTNTDYHKLFDQVLVDAPCSGLGTINHKPDLKYHLTMSDINDIIILQEKIINNACNYVKLNGYLTYSTCTINKQENEEQIKKFLNNHSNFEKQEELIIKPSNKNDGFYICKMKKVR